MDFKIRAFFLLLLSAIGNVVYRVLPFGFNEQIAQILLFFFYGLFVYQVFDLYGGRGFPIKTYFRPDLLFLAFYYIVFMFPYQMAIFGADVLYENRFISNLYPEYANQALYVAVLGAIGFMYGARSATTQVADGLDWMKSCSGLYEAFTRLNQTIFLIVVVGFYTFAAGQSVIVGAYTGVATGNSTVDGLYVLVCHFAMVVVALSSAQYSLRQPANLFDIVCTGIAMIWALTLLSTGDRNNFLLIVVAGIVPLAAYRVKIGLFAIAIGGFLAFSLYEVVEEVRKTGNRDLASLINGIFSGGSSPGTGLDQSSFSLTTITSRAIFSDNEEALPTTYGFYTVVGLMGVVPYLRSFLPNDMYLTSADFLTDTILGAGAGWSIGSSVTAELISDFGVFGLPATMFLVGWLGGKAQNIAVRSQNVISVGFYAIIAAYYSEYARYSYTFPVRGLVWYCVALGIVWYILPKNRRAQ